MGEGQDCAKIPPVGRRAARLQKLIFPGELFLAVGAGAADRFQHFGGKGLTQRVHQLGFCVQTEHLNHMIDPIFYGIDGGVEHFGQRGIGIMLHQAQNNFQIQKVAAAEQYFDVGNDRSKTNTF